jgi:DNA-binding transcriptional MerR regulator
VNSSSLLPIGAFSAATQLSPKALRLYAEHGILTPAKVDAETGYRYYRSDQVHQARLIRKLRELDMPLAALAEALSHPEAINTLLQQHMNFLTLRHEQQQAAYSAALALLNPKPVAVVPLIRERTLPAVPVLTHSFEADSNSLLRRAHALLLRVTDEAGQQAFDRNNCFIDLPYPLSPHDEITAELCVPTERIGVLASAGALRVWPSQTLACIDMSMQDDLPDWIAASDALFDWFDRNGASLYHAPLIFIGGQAPQLAWPVS